MVGANIELPAPHVVYDPTPETPPSHDLVTFDPTISNTLFTGWIIMAIIVVLAFMMSRAITRRADRATERTRVCLRVTRKLRDVARRPQARKYIPIFASLFVFILLSNWSGLVPPVGRIHELRAPTSDVNTTIGLALFSFVLFHVEGVRAARCARLPRQVLQPARVPRGGLLGAG